MNKRTGFTLVELLVVISLIGILSAVAIAVINPAAMMGKSRDARRKSDLKTLQGAIEMYYSQNRSYPANDSIPFPTVGNGYNTTWSYDDIIYVKGLPQDPLYNIPDSNGRYYNYIYKLGDEGSGYVLTSVMETAASTDDDYTVPGVYWTGSCPSCSLKNCQWWALYSVRPTTLDSGYTTDGVPPRYCVTNPF